MRAHRALAAAIALGLAACDASPIADDPGLDARMRVRGAQFFRGPMPQGAASGPAVAAITLPNNSIHPSFSDDPIGGALAPTATAAAVALEGDTGYWVVPAGAPSIATPDDPSFVAPASFSASLAPGSYTLVVRAVDAQGAFGPPTTQALTATALAVPTGELVITLAWDTESDLDLHVIDPSGVEMMHGSPTSAPQLPLGQDLDASASYGTLDFDSNARCVIDGRRQEDAVWPTSPPSGRYVVRVDTTSLCGQPIAHWSVTATLHGVVIAEARGTSVDADTRGAHDRGAGVTALQLDVP